MAVVESGAPVLATTAATAQIIDTALFAAIATTSATTTTAGSSQTITVASGTGIVVGMWLTIDAGAALETVQVTAVAGTSVTAIFANVHTGTYNVVANINRQIVSVGSPSVKTQIAEVDTNNRLNTITPDIVVTGQTLSGSATTNNNVIPNTAGFSILNLQLAGTGGSAFYTVEGSIDGANWDFLYFFQTGVSSASARWTKSTAFTFQGSVAGIYTIIIGGYSNVRVRCGSTGTGNLPYAYTMTNTNFTPLYGGVSGINIDKVSGNTGITLTPSDSVSAISSLAIFSFLEAFNGTNWDRVRKDSYANGPQWTTSGGGSTKVVAAAAGTTVVKASAGRLCKVLVTGGTISAALTFYDNATTTTGNVVGIIPATAAVTGIPFIFDWPCANGITGDFLTGSPAVSISYW
jgi:hypothetical protein